MHVGSGVAFYAFGWEQFECDYRSSAAECSVHSPNELAWPFPVNGSTNTLTAHPLRISQYYIQIKAIINNL